MKFIEFIRPHGHWVPGMNFDDELGYRGLHGVSSRPENAEPAECGELGVCTPRAGLGHELGKSSLKLLLLRCQLRKLDPIDNVLQFIPTRRR